MTDLYAALNIPRDADRATIRRAYRQHAKSAHPDGGGSTAKFALVKIAHDTLTDDARRARYDQTGEVEETPVDNERAKLLEMLATGLDCAMDKLYKKAKPPIQSDMVRLTKEALRELRQKWTGERREFEKNAERSEEMLGRWLTRGDANLMETITAHRVKVCRAQIAMLVDRIAVVDRALAVLDDAGFRADPVPERDRRDGMTTVTFQDMISGRF